jgi:hypothetical protein
MQRRGGAVGEHGIGSASEHGGHPPPFTREEVGWHQRVDGVVDAVKVRPGLPLSHPAGGEPEFAKLPERHYGVLLPRKRNDRLINETWGEKRDR